MLYIYIDHSGVFVILHILTLIFQVQKCRQRPPEATMMGLLGKDKTKLHHMHKFSRELEENTFWVGQHPQILNVFRSKIKSKEKRDKLWNVLGERRHKKFKSTGLTKAKTFQRVSARKTPSWPRTEWNIFVLLFRFQRMLLHNHQLSLEIEQITFSDISSTPLHKASQSDGINFLQRNHDGEGRTLAWQRRSLNKSRTIMCSKSEEKIKKKNIYSFRPPIPPHSSFPFVAHRRIFKIIWDNMRLQKKFERVCESCRWRALQQFLHFPIRDQNACGRSLCLSGPIYDS